MSQAHEMEPKCNQKAANILKREVQECIQNGSENVLGPWLLKTCSLMVKTVFCSILSPPDARPLLRILLRKHT